MGIAPSTLTLTYDWQIDPDDFNEILHHLHGLNAHGWHGPISAYVEYSIICAAVEVKELMRRINDYDPEGEPELEVSFF